MQSRIASNDWYYRKIRDFEVLPKDLEADLLILAKEGDKKARDTLIEHNLRFVMSQANKIYYGLGLSRKSAKFDLVDLIEEGNLGLFDAIRTFDPGFGTAFTSHAVPWIQQRIRRFVQENKACVSVPVGLQDFTTKYRGLAREFIEEIGRPPTPEEAAEALQVPKSRLKLMEQAKFTETSMNLPIGEDGTELQDLLACADPELRFDEEKLLMVIDLLDGKEAEVIKRRAKGETLLQIGNRYQVSRERIRQIEKKAIEHIKKRAIQVRRGIVTFGSEERKLAQFRNTLKEAWAPIHSW